MNIAVIPARGGSKRVPRKNIREFCGQPMIAWPIAAAQGSGLFDRIVVSTDCEAIAATARKHGAQVLKRPADLADDHTPTQPVIVHAITALEIDASAAVCCLYATAPFVRAEDLRVGRKCIANRHVTYSFAAARFSFPVQRAFYLDAAGRPQMFQPEHALTRSQDLPEAFHDAGQFYWARASVWKAGGGIFGPNARPVMLPSQRVQDIDTPEDWARAELLMRMLQSS